ncbi:hypothetical protein KM043_016506 [Ampulex compressa]|nr:hypothetical protein KM043_016506 [Ampulex compressa]
MRFQPGCRRQRSKRLKAWSRWWKHGSPGRPARHEGTNEEGGRPLAILQAYTVTAWSQVVERKRERRKVSQTKRVCPDPGPRELEMYTQRLYKTTQTFSASTDCSPEDLKVKANRTLNSGLCVARATCTL